MEGPAKTATADQGQRRAALKQKRSLATQRSLLHAAVSLWRTNGYANTTVADICLAAGVSKSLFFFYFPRKEDILGEMGVISTQTAHGMAHELLQRPSYEMSDVIAAVLAGLEQQMRRNPPELIIEIILEGYRQEHRILATGRFRDDAPYIFAELFERAHADGRLAAARRRRRASRGPRSIGRHRGCAPLGRRCIRGQVDGRCRR